MERTGGVGGAENHSTALDALDFAGFEVDNHQYLATNDFFGLVMFCNARNYRALVDAGVNSEFQEFVGLGNLLGGENGGGADVALIEIVKSNDWLLLRRLEILFLVLLLGAVEFVHLSLHNFVGNRFKEERRLVQLLTRFQEFAAIDAVPLEHFANVKELAEFLCCVRNKRL